MLLEVVGVVAGVVVATRRTEDWIQESLYGVASALLWT
jgi:hypothetical protein